MDRITYWIDYFHRNRYRTTATNDPARYNILKKAGGGTFGEVFKARDRYTLKTVAIKKAILESGGNEEIVAERDQYAVLGSHPNVTRLVASYEEKHKDWPIRRQCIIVDPFISNTLDEMIEKHKHRGRVKLAPLKIKATVFQILRAANYLHRRGLIHQDLKPPNVLVHPNTGHVALTDWGSLETAANATGVKSCTIDYRPPESDLGKVPYTTAFDFWSIGAIFAKLYRGIELFEVTDADDDNDTVFHRHCEVVGNPSIIDLPSIFPPEKIFERVERTASIDTILDKCKTPANAKALIKSMLQFNPANRVRPMEAMANAFFDELRASSRHRKLFDFTAAEVAGVDQALLVRVKPPQPATNVTSLNRVVRK